MTVTRVCPDCFHDWQDDHASGSCGLCECTTRWDENDFKPFSWLDYAVADMGVPRLHVKNARVAGGTKLRTSWVWFPSNQNTGLHVDRSPFDKGWWELEAWGPHGTALLRRKDELTNDDFAHVSFIAWRKPAPALTSS